MTSRTGLSRGWGALCGLLAAALAMGIAQLIAGLSVPAASPVIDVGSVAINHTPLPVKVWATSTFGTNDKTVLLTGVFVVVFLYAMLVGVLAARRLALGFAGLALFACLGIAAAVTRHGANAGYALPTVVGALAGAFALYRLIEAAQLMTGATAVERDPRGSGAARALRGTCARRAPSRRSCSRSRAAGPTTRTSLSSPARPTSPTSPMTLTSCARLTCRLGGAGRMSPVAGGAPDRGWASPVVGRGRPVAGPVRSFAGRAGLVPRLRAWARARAWAGRAGRSSPRPPTGARSW